MVSLTYQYSSVISALLADFSLWLRLYCGFNLTIAVKFEKMNPIMSGLFLIRVNIIISQCASYRKCETRIAFKDDKMNPILCGLCLFRAKVEV